MDQPPSTTNPSRITARRVLLTTVVAISAVAGPVGIVAASAGPSPMAAKATLVRGQLVHTETVSEPVRFRPVNPLNVSAPTLPGIGSVTSVNPVTTTTVAPTPTTVAPAPVAPPAPAPAPAPVPAPVATVKKGADPSDPAVWDRLATCEAGGNWAANTHNGYYGGLQFSASSWHAVGGTGLPHENSREVQIQMGQRLQARSGWGQWPACSRKLGYR